MEEKLRRSKERDRDAPGEIGTQSAKQQSKNCKLYEFPGTGSGKESLQPEIRRISLLRHSTWGDKEEEEEEAYKKSNEMNKAQGLNQNWGFTLVLRSYGIWMRMYVPV